MSGAPEPPLGAFALRFAENREVALLAGVGSDASGVSSASYALFRALDASTKAHLEARALEAGPADSKALVGYGQSL